MSFNPFGAKPNPRIKVAPPKFKVEKAPAAKKPQPLPSKTASTLVQRIQDLSRVDLSRSRSSRSTPDRLEPPRKRKAARQASPAQRRLESDSESDDNEVGSPASFQETLKRQKSERPIDLNRKLRSKQAFSGEGSGIFDIIHAADIASSTRKSKSDSKAEDKNVTVKLKYPSASQRERYDLVFGKEQINPAQEIYDVAKIVIDVYLTEEQKLPFTEPNSGYKRRIEKAMNYLAKDNRNKELLEGFKDAVNAYNKALGVLIQDGSLAKNLDDIHHLPSEMIKLILRQVYDRAVSPQVDILKNKKDNKDNTYGELLFQFVSEIFEETSLKSDQVFVDLGSGVGNVVLQAALEIGCESWGCEVMPNACELADAQEKEFAARCRLWGIETGKVRMERGDFRENPAIIKAIGNADVILVNNEVFGSDLNQDLINLFLTEVKNGCKIVSLKSFVPADHKITSRNQENPVNVLDVVQKYYSEDYVSWKHDSGEYYIATKDDTRVRRLLNRLE